MKCQFGWKEVCGVVGGHGGALCRGLAAALCMAGLISPTALQAQQAADDDELNQLREEVGALEARIDALEKPDLARTESRVNVAVLVKF